MIKITKIQNKNLQYRNLDKNQPQERNNNSPWLSGTCDIVGDSMVNNTDEKPLSKKHDNVKVFDFSGARIEYQLVNNPNYQEAIRLLNFTCRD